MTGNPLRVLNDYIASLHREHDAHIAFSADIMADIHDPARRVDGTWALRLASERAVNNGRYQDYVWRKTTRAVSRALDLTAAAISQWCKQVRR